MSTDDTKVVKFPIQSKDNTSGLVWVAYEPGKCQHRGVTYRVSEKEAHVVCGGCGTLLDPVWVLHQLALMESRWKEAGRAYQKLKAEHEQRQRCKCQHCGKFTRIRGM